MSDADSPTEGSVLTAVAWLLIVLGGLWTALAGLCTAGFLVWSVIDIANNGTEALGLVTVFGLVGIVPGALILWGGLALRNSQKRKTAAPPA